MTDSSGNVTFSPVGKVRKISAIESPGNEVKTCNRRRAQKPRPLKKKRASNSTNSPEPKRSRKTAAKEHFIELTQRARPRLNLDTSSEQEDLPSSDLSIELSVHEEPQPHLSFHEDEESPADEEEEDFPSFLMGDTKSSSITTGGFVWHKFRNYPFWPAMVKRVNPKMKRASIMVVDEYFIQKKRGFIVSLKTLKPYECEEFNELISKAKENYKVAIQRSVELIEDYIMRKGIGSFSGTFIEYYAHHISYPVRRKYQAMSERLTFATDLEMEESLSGDDDLDDSFTELQVSGEMKQAQRLLPDRTYAAHNRANGKLVNFIVKQHMVDQHLMAIMRGQQQSKWLCWFLSARRRRRRIVNVYLEDDEQLDQVYWYLSKLYTTAAESDACLKSVKTIDRVPFVLDVLLPEALIHAIAGVDNVSPKKAEEKYLKGRCISNRERQEFDLMIEQQMKTKSAV
ncbi:PWWP domain-containing DNA repair factor 3A-like [Eucyclogobius newberryi]|uniref:PWWP domain-containing DNA repair factor 3A-like n=1 Tax=Eucyclogobius newberryi TaxID=166745 RepID=UPI003B599C20